MNEQRPPLGHSVHPDGEGNYLIVGAPAPLALAQTLGATPGDGDVYLLINRQIVDHYRNPKSRRLWQQAMWDRAALRHRLRVAEDENNRLKGHPATMPDNVKWRRSTAAPVIHTSGAVEVALLEDGTVLVRNSDHPTPVLEFSPEDWTGFLEGVDNGEFDVPDNNPEAEDSPRVRVEVFGDDDE